MLTLILAYALAFGIIACNPCLKEKNQMGVYWVVGISLLLLTIFMDKTTLPDYKAYVAYFNLDELAFIEPSFVLIKLLVTKCLFGDVFFLFLIYAVLGIGVKLFAIKNLTRFVLPTLAVYIASYWTYHELIQIRAGVAAAVLLCSIKPLCERNLRLFLGIVLIACLFHYSSCVFFIFWFFNNSTKKKGLFMALMPLSMVLYLVHLDLASILTYIPIDFIQQKVVGYANISNELANRGVLTTEEYNPFITWYLIKVLVAFILWLNIERMSMVNRYAPMLLKIYTIGISLLWFFANIPVVATRTSELLGITQIVLLPLLLFIKIPKVFSYSVVLVYCFCWMFWNINSFII